MSKTEAFNNSSPLCAILGGVGPMAGVKLHEKVIRYSDACSDQDHMELVHLSTPIPDRTKFLLSKEGRNPGDEMFRVVEGLSKLANKRWKFAFAGVPCNTFHSPAIWNAFMNKTLKMNKQIAEDFKEISFSSRSLPGQVHIVNMLRKTVFYCSRLGVKKIGLLSTTGTRQTGVYRDMFAAVKIEILEVDESMQPAVHDAIYNTEYGIKALGRACQKVVSAFRDFVRHIKKKGATVVILGCTEIPIALPEKEFEGVILLDPLDILARVLVSSAGKLREDERRFLSRASKSYKSNEAETKVTDE